MKEYFGKEIDATETVDIPPEVNMAMLTKDRNQTLIGAEEVSKAIEYLTDYKSAKANLEKRIVNDELWYEMRHWETIRKNHKEIAPEPASGWLFNAIANKHADAMDNYPEMTVLPRERSDEASAKTLSSILPVVLEANNFAGVYDLNWWEKIKHGTAPYGVFWDSTKDGIGDISIKAIDILNIFWESGITDIQDSRNLFITELVDTDILEEQYPQFKGKLAGDAVDIAQYVHDDTIKLEDKSVVVDWYYKVRDGFGKTVLHYCKFVSPQAILYASENDPMYRDRGFYDHGKYPVVFDTLYPEKGTPAGFGYVAICKDPQLYIDKLSSNILETSMMATKKRFFVSESSNINIKDFADWNKPFVLVQGEINDTKIRAIDASPVDPTSVNVMQAKIEEMKETASNRDVNSGSSGSVTAAAGISALQEAGNKTSRDMIASSYRAYTKIGEMCIELMRQFYDETRSFRITGQAGDYEFVDFNNAQIAEAPTGMVGGMETFRKPIFDLKVKAMKTNPFSKMEQNERAKELYSLGFFNPEKAQESLIALDMMEFEGKDKIIAQIQQGATLLNIVNQLSQQNAMLMGAMGMPMAGQNQPISAGNNGGGINPSSPEKSAGNGLASGVMEAQTPMTSYGEALAKRSAPSMDAVSSGAMPR